MRTLLVCLFLCAPASAAIIPSDPGRIGNTSSFHIQFTEDGQPDNGRAVSFEQWGPDIVWGSIDTDTSIITIPDVAVYTIPEVSASFEFEVGGTPYTFTAIGHSQDFEIHGETGEYILRFGDRIAAIDSRTLPLFQISTEAFSFVPSASWTLVGGSLDESGDYDPQETSPSPRRVNQVPYEGTQTTVDSWYYAIEYDIVRRTSQQLVFNVPGGTIAINEIPEPSTLLLLVGGLLTLLKRI